MTNVDLLQKKDIIAPQNAQNRLRASRCSERHSRTTSTVLRMMRLKATSTIILVQLVSIVACLPQNQEVAGSNPDQPKDVYYEWL